MSTTNPGAVLFGKTRGLLLGWLYGHPDKRFYLRQLVRETGAAQGATQRELRLLAGAGLVTRTVEGRQVYFQANKDSPLFTELRQLLLKTVGAAEIIQGALTPIATSIDVAFLYGSAAKGTLKSGSDIDVLVIGDVSFGDVASALSNAQARLGRDVNPSVYSPREFRKKALAGHHFLTTVLREPKVFVIGSEYDLGRLAEKRMVDAASDERPRNRRSSRSRRA
jgi:predicted nucleotidyltransferase/DNA-binding transcriptional ArsR family regulator